MPVAGPFRAKKKDLIARHFFLCLILQQNLKKDNYLLEMSATNIKAC